MIQQQAQNNNIQLGMDLIRIQTPDPVWTQAQNAEATRLWAKFFSLGNTSNLHISIPVDWANFFTFLLLSPGTFTWSKQLLASKLRQCLDSGNGYIQFSIPTSCPKKWPHLLVKCWRGQNGARSKLWAGQSLSREEKEGQKSCSPCWVIGKKK